MRKLILMLVLAAFALCPLLSEAQPQANHPTHPQIQLCKSKKLHKRHPRHRRHHRHHRRHPRRQSAAPSQNTAVSPRPGVPLR